MQLVKDHIRTQGDGLIASGIQYFRTTGTDVQLYAEDANKHHLTWGVYGSALAGLDAWMADKDNGYSDATFQIGDGSNWVGNGYVGVENENLQCVFENAFVANTFCTATDPNGQVYGYKGGKLC